MPNPISVVDIGLSSQLYMLMSIDCMLLTNKGFHKKSNV